MWPGFLSDHAKFVKVADHSAAGTSDVTGASVDMAQSGGFDAVCFLTSFGTANAGNYIKAQQSDDDGSSDDFTDLEGTKVASGTSDEDVWLDLQKPAKRYVRPVGVRGASSTL